MPIKFRCQCGQQYAAKESMAGTTTTCRKCHVSIDVPELAVQVATSANSLDSLLSESEWNSINAAPPLAENACANCGAGMFSGAVLCTHCGYHKTLRRVLQTDTAPEPELESEVLIDEEADHIPGSTESWGKRFRNAFSSPFTLANVIALVCACMMIIASYFVQTG